MTVTDEMMEAFKNEMWPDGYSDDDIKRAISASLSASPAGVVKPLDRAIAAAQNLIQFLEEDPDNICFLDAEKVEVLRSAIEPAGVGVDEKIKAIFSESEGAPDPVNTELAKKGIEAGFDNHSVNQFAFAMRAKLSAKRREGRGGWHDKEYCSAEYLSRLLREHVEKGDPVDVANFCMMLHQRGERIAPPAPAALKGDEQ